MKLFKIKFNDNLQAIYTYITSYKHYIDINDLVDWCIQYEYYRELFENFHIIRCCIDQHNKDYPEKDLIAAAAASPTIVLDPDSILESSMDDNDLL